jgi:hypothetical protein
MASTAYTAPYQTTDLDEMARILNLPAFDAPDDTDQVDGNGESGNGRRCPHFGKELPHDWNGCSGCGIAQDCYDAWKPSQSVPTGEES